MLWSLEKQPKLNNILKDSLKSIYFHPISFKWDKIRAFTIILALQILPSVMNTTFNYWNYKLLCSSSILIVFSIQLWIETMKTFLLHFYKGTPCTLHVPISNPPLITGGPSGSATLWKESNTLRNGTLACRVCYAPFKLLIETFFTYNFSFIQL